MSLQIMIDSLKRVSNGVWEAKLSVKELGCLNKPALQEGAVSVMIVRNPVVSDDGRLQFSADQAPVINLGNSDRVVIVADGAHEPDAIVAGADTAEAATSERSELTSAPVNAAADAPLPSPEPPPAADSRVSGMDIEQRYRVLVQRHRSQIHGFDDAPVDVSRLEAG